MHGGSGVACVSAGQAEGALAALRSRPLARWINADCLGMTRSSGPHRKSEGERQPAWGCRRGAQREARRAAPFTFLCPFPTQRAALVAPLSWGQGEITTTPTCSVESVCVYKCRRMCVCGRSKAQCGREGYGEDNNSSENTDSGFN